MIQAYLPIGSIWIFVFLIPRREIFDRKFTTMPRRKMSSCPIMKYIEKVSKAVIFDKSLCEKIWKNLPLRGQP